MRTAIVFPVPIDDLETWNLFKPFVSRLLNGLKTVDAGVDYTLIPVLNCPDYERLSMAADELEIMLGELPVTMRLLYDQKGCDIGSFLMAAKDWPDPVFMVCMVTRAYPYMGNWLKLIVDAREKFGPGLYGTSASRQGGKLHLCTRVYAMDSDDFKKYPHQITSRDQGTFFEVYDGNLYEWYKSLGKPCKIVNADGVRDVNQALDAPECFRRGNQSNVIVRDKHTDAYRDSDETEKLRLEKLCFEGQA